MTSWRVTWRPNAERDGPRARDTSGSARDVFCRDLELHGGGVRRLGEHVVAFAWKKSTINII